MGLAHEQEIPEKKEEPKSEWTFRRIFPLKATVSLLAKNFTTPFDSLLAFLILVIGIGELLGRQVSWMTYLFAALILVADVVERQKVSPVIEEKKEKEKK